MSSFLQAQGKRLGNENLRSSVSGEQPGILQRTGVPGWVAATAFVALAMALTSGATPWLHSLGGAFRPPDFAIDIAAARVFAAGSNPYEVNIGALHAQVLDIPAKEGYPYFPHPPFTVLLFRPFANLPFSAAALLWFVASLGLLFALAALLAETVSKADVGGDSKGPSARTVWITFGLLLLWPPVLYNMEKGQMSIVLAVLVALAWRSLARRRFGEAGAWIGGAAAVKVFPVVLGGYLLLRAPRALIGLVVVATTLTFLPLVWMGYLALPAYLRHSAGNLAYWETWPAVTYSIHGAAARVLIGGQWAEPLIHAPALARSLVALLSLALVSLAAFVSWRTRLADDREGARFAAWATLVVLLNPLAMGHNGVLLALPILLVARALLRDRRGWPKVAWAAGVVLVSIPRQTAFSLAPVPLDPLRSLAVTALPMWGALLLFTVATATVLRDEKLLRLTASNRLSNKVTT